MNPSELAFVEVVAQVLGSNPRTQIRVYSTSDLLSDESLEWCGIGFGLESQKRELGFKVETLNIS